MRIDGSGSMSGEEFGPYRLLARLGAGGMGEVWRARDTRTDREVAIKRLRPALAGDPSFVAGFRREAALAAKLNHPAIVPIHSYGEIDDQLYIEMPLLAGSDLTTLIARDGPLVPARAVEVIAQVADALDTAHAAGLVHRDVKPSNVMVQARRRGDFVHLIDFGIARHADTTATHTGPGLVGTLTYMAPERFEGGPGDRRSDVYALAGVLFYAVTGQKPFVAPPNTEPDLLYYLNSHLHRPPPRPSDHASAAARADLARLDPVVARGMAKRPTERYASAGELAAAAHTALDTSAGNDSHSSPTVRTPHGFAAPTAPPARTPPPAPRVVSTVAGRAEPPSLPEQRYRPVVESRPPAPPAAPTTEPPGSGAARRRRIGMGIGALIVTLALVGAALVWANLPTTGTVPPQPTTPAAAAIIEHALTGHTNWVFGVTTAQLDGRTVVVSGSADDTMRVWDLTTGTPIGSPFTGHTGPVSAVATAQLDGRTVVISGSADDTVRVWDLATGAPVGSPFTGHTAAVAALTTAELDGRAVAISGSNDNTVRVWDLATGKPIGAPFTGHTGYVQAVTTAQLDGRTVVISGGDDNAVRVWDLATRAPVGAPFTGHTKRVVAVTTAQLRGRTVVVSGGWDDAVQVWDLATRTPAGSPFTDHTDFVCAVATAQLGERTVVISGGRDNTVRVWDLDARTRQ
jgi:serine/threonine protein kinase